MATASTKVQRSAESPEMASSASSKGESPSSESPNLGTTEEPGTSSCASSKEECQSSESPNLETTQSPETPSASSSKGESSAPDESPFLEFSETPEMPSSLSDKEESSAAVDSPPGTSKDGDEIDILSSNTASPTLISTIYSSISRITSEIKCCFDPCNKCCDQFNSWFNFLKCSKEGGWNFYSRVLFVTGGLGILIACFVLTPATNPFWEMLDLSILIIFCCFLSSCAGRGYFAKPPPPIFPKRKRASSPTKETEEESKKNAIPVTIQTDSPEDENIVVMDISGDPGTSASSGDGAVFG